MTAGPGAVSFDFHGCRLDFLSDSPRLAADIAEDFAYFRTAAASPPAITINALLRPPAAPAAGAPGPVLKTPRCAILKSAPHTRTVWYPEGALCVYDYRLKSGSVASGDGALLWELSYLLILSRVGEELERAGLHRAHAAAFTYGGAGVLLAGAPGAGKTTLLLEILKDGGAALLADDTPLVGRGGRLCAFPLRFGLAAGSPHLAGLPPGALRSFKRRGYPAKNLVSPAALGLGIAPAAKAGHFFLLKKTKAAAPVIRKLAPYGAAAELFTGLVAGYGVPQIAEYFLRLDIKDIAGKAGLLRSRAAAAASLWSGCGFHVLELSENAPLNAARLKEFLGRRTLKA
ncbi:MAG TPA: hypothetical protein PKI19_01980 [Elusimicrobiales bacterium]|nr:hypothetical protein [Elusimicrobiales bacterium]